MVAVCCVGVATLYFVPGSDHRARIGGGATEGSATGPTISTTPATATTATQETTAAGPTPTRTVIASYNPDDRVDTHRPVPPTHTKTSERGDGPASTSPASATTATSSGSPTGTPAASGGSATTRPTRATTSPPGTGSTPTGTPGSDTPGPDTTPPDRVANVRVTRITDKEFTLTFPVPSDDVGVEHYVVTMDSNPGDPVPGPPPLNISWGDVTAGNHEVAVAAVDAAGNVGVESEPVKITRPPIPPSATPSTRTESTGFGSTSVPPTPRETP